MVSRYVTNGPMKQEGICLLPPPHYRMIPPQRADGFPVSTPPATYVPSQQPNQGGNQGPGLRGITPTGPPNQASTPPNAEIKVQAIQQQPMNHMFVQSQVRPNQGTYFARATGPPNQAPRMANHNNRPQPPIFSPSPTQYVPVPQMYITSNSLPYATGYTAQRPSGFVQSIPTQMYGPHITAFNPYNPAPTQTQQVSYNFYQPSMMQRTSSISQVPPVNTNPSQNNLNSVPLVPSNPQHQTFQTRPQNRRRPNAIRIIDPVTGVDVLNEESNQTPSGESSSRQTPQPPPNKEVREAFVKQVHLAISGDIDHSHIEDSDINIDLGGNYMEQQQQPPYVTPSPQTVQLSKMDHVVQSSKLQAGAKEFVLSTNTAKETPIVSANCDSVEVTLPNKLPKDRESPVKGVRKPREQQQQQQQQAQQQPTPLTREHKDPVPVKEQVSGRDSVSDKEASNFKEEVKTSPEPLLSTNIVATNVVQAASATAGKDSIEENQIIVDKRTQKKDTKVELKSPSVERIEIAAPVVVVDPVPVPVQQLPATASQDSNASGKSKSNGQRSAPKQQTAPQNNNQKQTVQASAPVPPTQPTKSTAKSHKKNELNQKGANKEGTDMDAFNDNATLKEEVNANITSNNSSVIVNHDIVNANSLPAPAPETTNNVAAPVSLDVNVNIEANNKKFESNEMTINKPALVAEPVKTPKPKWDITSLVKDVPPKNIKPFISAVTVKDKPKNSKGAVSGTESQDETDRASLVPNDRFVQAENEVNTKTSETNRLENRLPYKEGQWSPSNQSGIKVYQKDFLLALKDLPASRKAPDNIPDVVMADERGRLSDGRSSMGGRTDFAPSFNVYGGGKSSSQRGVLPKRNSQSKMGSTGGKSKPLMKVSISVREDVKLHETENAWRPARFKKGENATSDDKKTEELYKKVRGVLNKLTPQKFDTLLAQIKALQIDNTERLQGVIDLCFDKAVDEPNYSVAYALMCRELALMQVPTSHSTEENPEYVNFRKLLVTRCQVEFEKQSVDESTRNEKLKEIEECTDPEKKKDLQFDLEEHDRRLRMKSVGNIRFIGELFKQKMLTVNIMMRCLTFLLENKDEESLECLCKLVTTIGKELESNNVNLNGIFNSMKSLVDNKKDARISSRIRFMIQDVIDLRNSKWVPRRQDFNPKTIDQIQKEADHEQMNIQMMNSGPITPRKDDRSNQSSSSNTNDRKQGRGRNVSDDGWMTMNTNRSRNTFSVQSDKLKSKAPPVEEPLGSSSIFGAWGKGSVGSMNKSSASPAVPSTVNMYAPLENMEVDKRNLNTRPASKNPYHSKGPSLERNYNSKYVSGGSRSGSQHKSSDSSGSSSQSSTPAPMLPPQTVPKPVVVQPSPVETPKMSEDQILRRITNNLEEYFSGYSTVDEFANDLITNISYNKYITVPMLVEESYKHVLEKNQLVRLKTGQLFSSLIKQGFITVADYYNGLGLILSQADDLRIDIPKIWDYIAELIFEPICEGTLELGEFFTGDRCTEVLLASLLKLIVSKKGPNFLRNLWERSSIQLAEIVGEENVERFIKDNHFEFLVDSSAIPPASCSALSYEEIQQELYKLISSGSNMDQISDWITANVGDKVKEKKFVRALATAVFEDSIEKKSKLVAEKLTHHSQLLLKYGDNDEIQILFALQALIHKMEHPQGLLLQICDKLHELGTISQDGFIVWEKDHDPAEQEGKGVALMQLVSFFTQLKENDESSGSDQETGE